MVSKTSHRRFPSVSAFVSELGGDKGRVIEKVFIANNGVAAVKAIRSIRRWAYECFGDEKAISFVVMATPEDLRANAEYIRMADVVIDVQGGSNNHNYANVSLIVELARLHRVHAVWAGWGHASENPLLPNSLESSTPPIKFIGPAGPPMQALGDKIGSTIIAQSANVPCIAWNGSAVIATYDKHTGSLPAQALEAATIANVAQAQQAADRIGYPVMIKASEGGGGKGIRRVEDGSNVANAFRQVCGEVPGSPIFIMKLSSNARHLEVQLLADEYGDAVALNGRDCSVQRRHQKIIEEGPPVAAKPEVWKEMEQAAVSLAKAVHYTNAGTVEYLYDEQKATFYFLELNPRLQVEHPVTEMITKVNLPAAQLQVAMGIPLSNIPDIRELYGRNRFEEDYSSLESKIDFNTAKRIPPHGHCIAVRITAENAEAGFKPTSGVIEELNFRSTPNVWGYFSMDSSGSIHEFADSQFGHLFANGADREQARRNMALALKELSIRGDISTTIDYISKLIEVEDFVVNNIHTGWLDEIINYRAEKLGHDYMVRNRRASVKVMSVHHHVYVVMGAIIMAFDTCIENEQTFLDLLKKGQLPPQSLLVMQQDIELILNGVKYKLRWTRTGAGAFSISLRGTKCVDANVRKLSDDGYLIGIAGTSRVIYLSNKGDSTMGMRLNFGGAAIIFSADYDPTALRTDVAGKLVKKLARDGEKVKKGQAYCEIEVMKMFMPLKVGESGILSWHANEGAAIAPGDLLATLELENPENVATISVFEGDLAVKGWGSASSSVDTVSKGHPHLLMRSAINKITGVMSGFVLSSEAIDAAFADLASAVTEPMLPVFEIKEQLSVLSGRIPSELYLGIDAILDDFRGLNESHVTTEEPPRFPAEAIASALSKHADSITDSSERSAFSVITRALKTTVDPYTKSKLPGIPGSERALQWFISVLRDFTAVERWFSDGQPRAEVVDRIRKNNKDDLLAVLALCRSHEQLNRRSVIIKRIISIVGDASRDGSSAIAAGAESLPEAMAAIAQIGSMGSADVYSELALRARKLLIQDGMPSIEHRKHRMLAAAKTLTCDGESKVSPEAETFLADHIPMLDVFLSLLGACKSSSEQVGLLELYQRHLYRLYTIESLEKSHGDRTIKFTFTNKPSDDAVQCCSRVSSISDLSDIASSGSLNTESESADRDKIPHTTLRTGVSAILDNLSDAERLQTFQSWLSKFPQNADAAHPVPIPVNVLYLFILGTQVGRGEKASDETAANCHALLTPHVALLRRAGVRRITFVFPQQKEETFEDTVSVLFTFRFPDFVEDSFYRKIDPSLSMHLDLNRVAGNFIVRRLESRHTTTAHVHIYEGTPRQSALSKDVKLNEAPRVFARALSFIPEFSAASYERVLVDALNTLEFCDIKSKANNHVFLNLLSDFRQTICGRTVIEEVVATIMTRHAERISGLGVIEVETRILCCLRKDEPAAAIRVFSSNPTGYVHVMNTYEEAQDESGERIFKLMGGTNTSTAAPAAGFWDGLSVQTPYPLIRPFDAQRKAALKSSGTLYCYDLPAVLEAAVARQWLEASKNGNGGASPPHVVLSTKELVVQKRGRSPSDAWTMEDYFNGKLELIQMNRRAGENDVGMVAWLVLLKTVEYPDGRQVVLVANDITFKAGSFGTREDVVFKMASEFARENRIPRLYVAANAGARIGLAARVKKCYKVAFKDEANPETGFKFLYVTKEDYANLTKNGMEIRCVPEAHDGQIVCKITDIIGSEPDLGVENLKGSGLIAGETSLAYDEVFTMTIVLGRSVGIGAYLVRLGQRTIQRLSNAPIILTGYQALNKLMGVNVYSTNDQLGGPGIMYPNGVSHLVAPDDLQAIKSAVDWLSFIPSTRGAQLPIRNILGIDEVDRCIAFSPQPGVPYDPRALLTGTLDDDGDWQSGFFDRGSFIETMAGWAKSVVVGRARLGGIPVGVVATENRTSETVKPADPADVTASETVIQEAGCVWFPNSAYKTAQAVRDFRSEDLPLIVFGNWRGFSGGQRDMFDEVLKYGSLIVDAFVAFEQPIFVFIPPFAEIRGGAWVVVDASINASVMEMYAAKDTARGGVLEATGLATIKYRSQDLIATMHRLDDVLQELDQKLAVAAECDKAEIVEAIESRQHMLLPVYTQISVQFCDLHDTPARMKAVGVIREEIEWSKARSFFYWRLRRKLAEFRLRKQLMNASHDGAKSLQPLEATNMIKHWFLAETKVASVNDNVWDDDKVVLTWMAENKAELEKKVVAYAEELVARQVVQVIAAGGSIVDTGIRGVATGLRRSLELMSLEDRERTKHLLAEALSG